MNIQWYPGHMAKTRRMIEADLRQVHGVCEILDARIPRSSRNPDIDALTAGKPRLLVLNRADQADPEATARWSRYFQRRGLSVLETDSKSGRGIRRFPDAVRELLSDRIRAWTEKGQPGRVVRVMVLGIPNVGKSTFINRAAGRKSAKAEDRPGVTRGKQWVTVDRGLELLDTPGILWPKLGDQETGLHLAFTGAVRDEVLDTETLACHLLNYLSRRYPEAVKTAFRLETLPEGGDNAVLSGFEVLKAAAVRRGCRISGGEPDTERMARLALDEFRSGKLGRFTLEEPEAIQTTTGEAETGEAEHGPVDL